MESSKGGEIVVVIRHLIEWSALGIEVLAVAVIVVAVIILSGHAGDSTLRLSPRHVRHIRELSAPIRQGCVASTGFAGGG
jgi:hypothetical protein